MVVVAMIASSVSSFAGVTVGTVKAPTLPTNGYYLRAVGRQAEGPDRREAGRSVVVSVASPAMAVVPVAMMSIVSITSFSRIFVATLSPTTAHGGHVDFLAQVMNPQHFSCS